MLETVLRNLPASAERFSFTRRERDVVLLALDGLKSHEIAERLHIAPSTTNDYLQHIFAKTGARSRSHMVALVFGWNDL